MLEEFKTELGRELPAEMTDTLFPALDTEPEVSVRLNERKMPDTVIYPEMTPVEWCRSGFYLPSRPNFTLNPLLHAGAFYVQDASSMVYQTIVEQIAGPEPVVVADLCAAPGGKSTAILNALPEGSVLLANEFTPSRAKILKENLIKYGYPDTIVTSSDVARLAEMGERFDIIAVDAPCSGEGMMRKEEVARTQWSRGLVAQCATLQREILANAVRMLKPGGYLIYSTCTFNVHEDEENAEWLAAELGLTPVDTGLAGIGGIRKGLSESVPCIRFMPGFTKGEGLFLALFRKGEEETEYLNAQDKKSKSRNKDRKGKEAGMAIDRKLIAVAADWLEGDYEIRNVGSRLIALSPQTASLLESIPSDVHILSAGVEVGEVKGKDLIPAHALAMSTALRPDAFPRVDLSETDALAYLAREPMLLPADTPKGYVMVTFEGFPLGFMKNIGNRANNLYPQEYRIRILSR